MKKMRKTPKHPLFSRAPLAMACAMLGAGNCLAQPVEQLPSPVLRMALQLNPVLSSRHDRPSSLARSAIAAAPQPDSAPALRLAQAFVTPLEKGGTVPCRRNPQVLAQAWIPGSRPGLLSSMTDVIFPLLTADSEPCEGTPPMLLAQADMTLAGMQVAAGAAPRPGKGKSALINIPPPLVPRQDGYLQLAQADMALMGMQVATAAAPQPGKGKSALAMVAPPLVPRQDEALQLAQADPALAGMQVATVAAPQEGGGESALIMSAPVDATRLRRNRASATANMRLAQGPANGNGNGGHQNGSVAAEPGTWQIPPIRWGGDVSLDIYTHTSEGAPRTTQVFETIGVTADSYIYQPWFARVGGGLRLMKFNNGLTKGLATEDSGSTTVTGDGNLMLFPVSRFPFTAAYNVTDSKTTGSLLPNGYTSRRLSFSQSYSPAVGNQNYLLNYERSTIDPDIGSNDVASSLTGYMNDRGDTYDYQANFGHYRNKKEDTGDKSEFDSFGASYNYHPNATLTINNMLNMGQSKYDMADASADTRNRYFQLNSFGTWRPEETSPLMVTGGARYYESASGVSGDEVEARTVSGNAAATYTLNRNVTLSASGTLTETSLDDADTRLTYLSGEANYNADPIRLGEYNYGWGGAFSSRYDQQSGANESSHSTNGVRVRHNINRNFPLAENSSISAHASQSLAKDYGYLSYLTLTTDGGVSWTLKPSDRSTTMLGINVADTNSRGESDARQHFQMVNLQGNGQVEISRHSTFSANLTVQGTRQLANTLSTNSFNNEFSWNSHGNMNYNHTQAFGVPRLRYTATFDVNQFRNQSRFDGNIDSPVEHVNKSFEQRFNYDIGRTALELRMRYADIEGRNSSMIFFRVVRQFGGY